MQDEASWCTSKPWRKCSTVGTRKYLYLTWQCQQEVQIPLEELSRYCTGQRLICLRLQELTLCLSVAKIKLDLPGIAVLLKYVTEVISHFWIAKPVDKYCRSQGANSYKNWNEEHTWSCRCHLARQNNPTRPCESTGDDQDHVCWAPMLTRARQSLERIRPLPCSGASTRPCLDWSIQTELPETKGDLKPVLKCPSHQKKYLSRSCGHSMNVKMASSCSIIHCKCSE